MAKLRTSEAVAGSLSRLLHQGINLLDGSVLLCSEGQVHHGDIRGWHTLAELLNYQWLQRLIAPNSDQLDKLQHK